jgi:general secretion pathway protein J
MQTKKNYHGFTLLELLLALFIFAIISLILTATLHNILSNQSRLQQHNQSFTELQMALLLLSRDFEQIVNRPIINYSGTQEAALIGYTQQTTFTHTGLANPKNLEHRSTLQRTRYRLESGKLIREAWPVLDQAPRTQPQKRILLNNVTDLQFSYLSQQGRLEKLWPANDKQKNQLPRAIQIFIVTQEWGKITQLFIVPTEAPIETSALEQKPAGALQQGNSNELPSKP